MKKRCILFLLGLIISINSLAETNMELAKKYYEKGDYAQAIKYYKLVEKENNDDSESAIFSLGFIVFLMILTVFKICASPSSA